MARRAASDIDQVRFNRPDHLGGVELVTALYRHRSFPAHAHEEYVLGAMTAGAEILSIRGEDYLIDRNRLLLIGPGEVHSNRGATDGSFGYAVMYIPTAVVSQAVFELTGSDSPSLPRFEHPAPSDPALRSTLLRAHSVLRGDNGVLSQESALVLLLSELFLLRHLRRGQVPTPTHRQNVGSARDYIEAHFRDSFSLGHLAQVAGISRFHLVRSFRDHVGLTPAAYHMQLRVREAKRLIRSGYPIAGAAADVGFSDQSHLTRHFQRIVGTSPGRYAQQ